MFQGFQKEASDFFWEMCFNNEREWFHHADRHADEGAGKGDV